MRKKGYRSTGPDGELFDEVGGPERLLQEVGCVPAGRFAHHNIEGGFAETLEVPEGGIRREHPSHLDPRKGEDPFQLAEIRAAPQHANEVYGSGAGRTGRPGELFYEAGEGLTISRVMVPLEPP